MQKKPRTYNIWTIGCQMNEADSRHLSSQLESLGYQATPSSSDADLVVLNTCVVRQQAEDKAIGKITHLRKFKNKRPSMTIALMGCMVGVKEATSLKKRFPFIDVFMPPSETQPLLDHLTEQGLYDEVQAGQTREKAWVSAMQDEDFRYNLPALEKGKSVTAHVPIVLGCSHACTFCIIPYRRGVERSKPKADILAEVRALSEQGVKEVTLLGQIVDRYGTDFDEDYDLSDLLRDVSAVDALERVRFLTSHPNWMSDEIIETVATTEKICPHFEIPSQAGNNEVLLAMRRGYDIETYEAVVEKIRARIPEAAIHTDIIVGFPGETEAQFMDTYRHIERIRPDKVHLAKYSARPTTVATRGVFGQMHLIRADRRPLRHGL